MTAVFRPEDPINKVLNHEVTEFTPVTVVYEGLGPLEIYRTEQRYLRWRNILEQAGTDALEVDYQTYYELELGIETDILDGPYPPPAWLWFPTLASPAGCAIKKRGGELFWRDAKGKETRIPPRHAPHENTADSKDAYATIWEQKGRDVKELLEAAAQKKKTSAQFPSADEVTARVNEKSFDLAKALQRRYPNLAFYKFACSPYDSLTLSFKQLMEALIDYPELVHRILENNLPQPGEALPYLAARRLGVGIVFLEECLASADIISPRMYKEFSFPYTKKALQYFNDLGFKTVLYFSGNPMPLLSYLKELPFTAVSFEEDRKNYGIDLGEIRRVLGPDRVLLGNVNASFLEKASEQEILDEVKHQINLAGRHGNFILSTGSPVTPGTSLERLRFFLQSTRRL